MPFVELWNYLYDILALSPWFENKNLNWIINYHNMGKSWLLDPNFYTLWRMTFSTHRKLGQRAPSFRWKTQKDTLDSIFIYVSNLQLI